MTRGNDTGSPGALQLAPSTARALADGLGWFSIGLGVLETFAPEKVTRPLGLRGNEPLVQAYGLRELAAGIGILASRDPTPWLWGRVAGDGLDLATLASVAREDNRKRSNVGLALAAVAGIAILDVVVARSMAAERDRRQRQAGQGRQRLLRAYHNRSGFRRGPEAALGAARDFAIPRDFRTPELLRRWV